MINKELIELIITGILLYLTGFISALLIFGIIK
jgi:hypothetical protein